MTTSKTLSDGLREVMGTFATGVTVMTTTVDGQPHGMTANAVSSVSLDPALVLVCVDRGTVMSEAVRAGGCFALSVLADDQRELSNRFADPSRPTGHPQFAGVAARAEATGAPVLDGALGWVDCRVWAEYDGGDHIIVVGEVEALDTGDERAPLLFHRGRYRD